MPRSNILATVAIIVCCAASARAATLDELANRPIALRSGIGSAHDAVTTSSKEAQAWYDQGLALLHSYVWLDAARSFNQALRLDPSLAMAHIGLTFCYAELNAPAMARAALDKAQALAPATSDHDRRHIAARRLQMEAESSVRDRSAPLAAYRAALDGALGRYPDDEELWLLRGHAESSDAAERGQGSGAESVRFYEHARTLAPAHPSAHHYLTHAYENSGRIDEALAEGAVYARIASDVAHAHHMYGHNLRRTGRMIEAIREFRAADAIHTAWSQAEDIPAEYDWNYQHNLDLLATSYQYVGQMRNAEPLLKASFAIASSIAEQELNKREWPLFLRARGRVGEALAAARVMAAHRSPLVSALGHVESGRALLLERKFQEAAAEANEALRLMRDAPEGAGLVANPLAELQGEFFLRTGQQDRGRAMLRDAVRTARLSRGPDAWIETTFAIEAIARAARETGDWELAAWAANQMIDHDPNYAGAHLAQALVAEHNGDHEAMQRELERVKELWKDADAETWEPPRPQRSQRRRLGDMS